MCVDSQPPGGGVTDGPTAICDRQTSSSISFCSQFCGAKQENKAGGVLNVLQQTWQDTEYRGYLRTQVTLKELKGELGINKRNAQLKKKKSHFLCFQKAAGIYLFKPIASQFYRHTLRIDV